MARKQQQKKVRKQHNPRKRLSRMVAGTFRTWTWQGLAQIESRANEWSRRVKHPDLRPEPHTKAVQKMGGSWLPVPLETMNVINKTNLNWVVGLRALGVRSDGEEYVESVTFTMKDFRLKDLADERSNFKLWHELTRDLKSSEIYDTGWCAATFSGDSWEADNERVGDWITKGLGWLPPNALARKRDWDEINADVKLALRELNIV